jgi:hypothetical protein
MYQKDTCRTRAAADARGGNQTNKTAAHGGKKNPFRKPRRNLRSALPFRTMAGTENRPAESSASSATASGDAGSPQSMIALPGAVTRRAQMNLHPQGFAPAGERILAPVFVRKQFGVDYLTVKSK